jgi:hypothetical protein
MLACAQAAAGPEIALKPDTIPLIELPAGHRISMWFTISNLDSGGTVPLAWTISDVVKGTDNDCAWVTESPVSGTVPPADSGGVGVTFNTARVPGGTYAIDLRIDSNDPIRPRVILPVKITVVVATKVRRTSFGELKARYR